MAQHVMPTVFTRVQQSEAVRNHRPQRVSRVAPVGRQAAKTARLTEQAKGNEKQ
jgi:hypothetical protein